MWTQITTEYNKLISRQELNTENGRFGVKFIPEVLGAYSIEVKISGDTLANSPYTVAVKECELTV